MITKETEIFNAWVRVKERLIAVYKDWLIDNPRQLRSYALGNQFSNDDFSQLELVTDIDAFKREHNKL
jgi:hypothetical protein